MGRDGAGRRAVREGPVPTRREGFREEAWQEEAAPALGPGQAGLHHGVQGDMDDRARLLGHHQGVHPDLLQRGLDGLGAAAGLDLHVRPVHQEPTQRGVEVQALGGIRGWPVAD